MDSIFHSDVIAHSYLQYVVAVVVAFFLIFFADHLLGKNVFAICIWIILSMKSCVALFCALERSSFDPGF